MNKNKQQKIRFKKYQVQAFCFLILTLLLTVKLSLFNLKAIANETNNQPKTNQQTTETDQDTTARTNKRRGDHSILTAIWQLLKSQREREPALSSRSNICEITPGLMGDTNLVYSDRPLFLWQGTASNLKINLYSPFSWEAEQELLWTQAVNGEFQSVLYTGDALQPGQIYDWEIIVDSQANRRRISFQVIEQEERDRIASELQQLETQLASAGASAEEIALEKAHFFAEQDLWSDALQQLHSIENPSTVAANNIKEITHYICQSEQANSTN